MRLHGLDWDQTIVDLGPVPSLYLRSSLAPHTTHKLCICLKNILTLISPRPISILDTQNCGKFTSVYGNVHVKIPRRTKRGKSFHRSLGMCVGKFLKIQKIIVYSWKMLSGKKLSCMIEWNWYLTYICTYKGNRRCICNSAPSQRGSLQSVWGLLYVCTEQSRYWEMWSILTDHWPIAPSYMSPNAGVGRRGVAGS